MKSNQDRQPLRDLNADRQHILKHNAVQQAQGRINMPHEENRKETTRIQKDRRAEIGRKNTFKPEKLMQDSKQHQGRRV
jgi:hypothetical protein